MPAVSWSVRHIRLSLVLGVALVLFAVALVGTEAVRVILLDEQMNTQDSVQVDLHLPFGTPFATTLANAEDVARAAHAMNEQLPGESIHGVSILVGTPVLFASHRGKISAAATLAAIRVHLNDRPIRVASPVEIERAWREQLGDLSNVEKIEFQTTRVLTRPTVAYALQHDDMGSCWRPLPR